MVGLKWKGRLFVMFLAMTLLAACSQPSSSKPAPESSGKQAAKEPATAGQKPQITTLEEIAAYKGDDREQILIEKAKKEGSLMVYGAMPVEDMKAVTDAFTKKYGIKVDVWRSSSENVLQRVLQETKSGRHDFDVVDNNGPEMEAAQREGVFQKIDSPYQKDLVEAAVLPHKEWVGTRINIFTQAYNTKLIKKEDLPKNYEDLLDPKWKGKLAIEEGDMDWLAALCKEFGEEKTAKLFQNIVASNGISVRKGHSLLTEMVASGEVPFSLTVYNYKADQLKKAGAPIDWFAIEPAIARPNGLAVSKHAKHPFAAVLFYDFMISDAQEILSKRSIVPTSRKVDTELNKMPLKFVDPAIVLDEYDKWQKLFNDTIVSKNSKK